MGEALLQTVGFEMTFLNRKSSSGGEGSRFKIIFDVVLALQRAHTNTPSRNNLWAGSAAGQGEPARMGGERRGSTEAHQGEPLLTAWNGTTHRFISQTATDRNLAPCAGLLLHGEGVKMQPCRALP